MALLTGFAGDVVALRAPHGGPGAAYPCPLDRAGRAEHLPSLTLRGADSRLRPGYRLLAFVLIFYAFGGVFSVAYRLGRHALPASPSLRVALTGLALVVIGTAATVVARTRIDHRSVASLGLGRAFALRDLAAGMVFSLAFLAGTVAVLAALGLATIRRGAITPAELALLAFGSAFAAAWWEELVFRGYIYQTLQEGLGTGRSVALACIPYGCVHLINPNATVGSALVIAPRGTGLLLPLHRLRARWQNRGAAVRAHGARHLAERPGCRLALYGDVPVRLRARRAVRATRTTLGSGIGGRSTGALTDPERAGEPCHSNSEAREPSFATPSSGWRVGAPSLSLARCCNHGLLRGLRR
jgi:membrane protease YdiL (CAAX protease family)